MFEELPDEVQGYIDKLFSSMMSLDGMPSLGSGSGDAERERPDAEDMVEELLSAAIAERNGREWIAGEWAYVVEIIADPAEVPPDIIDEFGTLTVWIGNRSKMPLGVAYIKGPYEYFNVRVTDADFDNDIQDEVFVLDFPADAKIITVDDFLGRLESFENSEDDLGDTSLTPGELPAGATLQNAFERDGLSMWVYSLGKGERFSILIADSADKIRELPSNDRAKEVRIRGTTGHLFEGREGRGVWLYWHEADQFVVITGALSVEEAVEIAESLE
jgi:hypothetical protein